MRVANSLGELYCNQCERWRAQEAFAIDQRAKSGRASWCRECHAEARRQRMAKEKMAQLRALAKTKQLQPIF